MNILDLWRKETYLSVIRKVKMSDEGGVSGTLSDGLVLGPYVAALKQVHVVVMWPNCYALSICSLNRWY